MDKKIKASAEQLSRINRRAARIVDTLRSDRGDALLMIKKTGRVSQALLAAAECAGMIKKGALIDGSYYAGSCRNSDIAQWSAEEECFFYVRSKFGSSFAEAINHPEDDDGYDLFIPLFICSPTPEERVENYRVRKS